MTAQRETSARLLWSVVLLLVAAAGLLWGASALTWASRQYRTPFSGEVDAVASGAVARPELVPLALAALAAVAAVLATGGLLRRVVGALTLLGGALLLWRAGTWWFAAAAEFVPPGVPSGGEPVGEPSAAPFGPLLVVLAGLALLAAGALVAVRAGRMPAMGARYSAPGAEKRKSTDPDKRLWDALDEGADPTDER
ncbi:MULTISPECIES: Trp biosynthesis-associated membrane protein [unclassified Saccharopolyspora]|uniref:Trp biosynthesis-associated membrane protein n=1 Tax=unclassified Saccharopolyspora TaxID=2646250 RepID=UPI001CD1B8E9|nr:MULTISPECIES: Trp biosynthesis-associated membrane protein [unclassified Saccharopolyspora]MCA1187112.1 Trp biosynthesis-associated membrane protein [Saccharopolyspora sp. 6T]MCA1193578.1 Trp biosynthesis-associated membrane protein [Saccharopolyspora sp. 6V]MCA1227876.1 Trp biosynthesis-associated membrane protein [Saccharopolyspora sp. 6M]MCA1280342.1 Trp biosynthesis-associated membrane protein [Saccharopolyspora sp. 7B]